jgi:hypothetical protein
MSDTNRLAKISRETLSEVLAGAWREDRSELKGGEDESTRALRRLLQTQHPLIVDEVFHCLKEHQPLQTEEEDFLLIEEPDDVEDAEKPVAIPPLAYLRAMLTIAWSAFRHPWSTTTIDLATGRVIHRE